MDAASITAGYLRRWMTTGKARGVANFMLFSEWVAESLV
jgi:hypothetical protein